jgi:hypothetical protein
LGPVGLVVGPHGTFAVDVEDCTSFFVVVAAVEAWYCSYCVESGVDNVVVAGYIVVDDLDAVVEEAPEDQALEAQEAPVVHVPLAAFVEP